MKIVINTYSGGTFALSQDAERRYRNYAGVDPKSKTFYYGGIERTDPHLLRVIEELGAKANGTRSHLEVREIPDDVQWELEKKFGVEEIHEKHRVWK